MGNRFNFWSSVDHQFGHVRAVIDIVIAEMLFDVFFAHAALSHHCRSCYGLTFWKLVVMSENCGSLSSATRFNNVSLVISHMSPLHSALHMQHAHAFHDSPMMLSRHYPSFAWLVPPKDLLFKI